MTGRRALVQHKQARWSKADRVRTTSRRIVREGVEDQYAGDENVVWGDHPYSWTKFSIGRIPLQLKNQKNGEGKHSPIDRR